MNDLCQSVVSAKAPPSVGKTSLRNGKRIRRAALAGALWFAVASVVPALGQNAASKTPEVLQGRLTAPGGNKPVLKTPQRDYTLTAKTPYLLHTLEDERLTNREVRLEGAATPGGGFEVAHLFTVRDGKLYKVRYYCEICNIPALEPGKCVCCQRPTELQEIPVSDVGKDTVVVP